MDPILKDYDNDIQAALEGKFELHIDNDDREHALVVVKNLIASAKSEIILLCHKLSKEIYNNEEVIKALKAAYRHNPALKCIAMVRRAAPDDSSFLNILLQHGAGIYCEVDKNEKAKKINDAIIIDRRAARLETDENESQADVIICRADSPMNDKRKRILTAYLQLRELHELL